MTQSQVVKVTNQNGLFQRRSNWLFRVGIIGSLVASIL